MKRWSNILFLIGYIAAMACVMVSVVSYQLRKYDVFDTAMAGMLVIVATFGAGAIILDICSLWCRRTIVLPPVRTYGESAPWSVDIHGKPVRSQFRSENEVTTADLRAMLGGTNEPSVAFDAEGGFTQGGIP